MGAMENISTSSYVDWEEMVVSSDKGRREVQYYLKRGGGGGKDLVVMGKEKSVRHMTYHYVVKDNKFLLSILNGSSRLKLRSRREVIDWLNSIISVSSPVVVRYNCARTDDYLGCRNINSISKSWLRASESPIPILGEQSKKSCRQFGGGMERNYDDNIIEDVLRQKSSQSTAEFTNLGSSWTCRKRRTHYQSFCRNGAVISAHEFVYVLAEEGKRLVAYLDDMYEDNRGNKMVVVRWFHKIDEVGYVLPHNYNDREIFFSLWLQDLNIECIDGLATVLSPEHYEKLSNEATRKGLVPFVCCKLFDNDDVKPFDITQIKGYWKQEIFRNRSSPLEFSVDDLKSKGHLSEVVGFRPNKRIRWSQECNLNMKSPDKGGSVETSLKFCGGPSVDCKGHVNNGSPKGGCSSVSISGRVSAAIGSQVEVLSQDSGIRGCWFRALIIKKHKGKVKVQYQDVKDAVDDSKNLEEWILASRIAAPDSLGVRSSGRTIIRPNPSSYEGGVSGLISVGTFIDAWWHDGWWEGIVVNKESEDRLTVYFPDEKREHIFSPVDLRHSKEWIDNRWQNIKQRLDLVSQFYGTKIVSGADQKALSSANDEDPPAKILNNDPLPQKVIKIGESMLVSDIKMPNDPHMAVRDLSKDCLLAQLRWKSTGKRRLDRSTAHKGRCGNITSSVETGLRTFEKLFANSSPMRLDSDNCKYASDSNFGSSVVPNLVMSR